MFKMSFFDGTLKREELKKIIEETNKPIKYTYGLAYRGPTIYKVLIDKEKAKSIVDNESLLDAREFEDYIHLNAYSDNDMY